MSSDIFFYTWQNLSLHLDNLAQLMLLISITYLKVFIVAVFWSATPTDQVADSDNVQRQWLDSRL